jgi:hypothetical protein
MASGVVLLCLYALVVQADARSPRAKQACPPPSTRIRRPAPRVILPTHTPAPGQVLVCVGPRAITGAVFEHWKTVAIKSEGANAKKPPPQGELIGQMMGFLISSDWVLEEAPSLHVHVSAAMVKRRFDLLRHEQFHTSKEFAEFLTRSGQTVADLMLRVKVNLLSARIQRHVVAGHRSEASKQHALKRFLAGFKHRWLARTYCSREYSSADCGHILGSPL